MQERYQREGWFLDAAAIYCDAMQSLAGYLASAPLRSRGLRDFRDYAGRYVASDGFAALARDTGDRERALGQIRYRTRIHGDRVDVSRYNGEADYSNAVLATFERFKQGATRDYRVKYRTWPGMNHVAAQILMERQIGRARGDLQYRLEEATRALVRVVGQRYADGTDRIRSALAAAADLREVSASVAAAKELELARRESALRHVTSLLGQVASR